MSDLSKDERERRRAEALRANLRRRKAQAREVEERGGDESAPPAPPHLPE